MSWCIRNLVDALSIGLVAGLLGYGVTGSLRYACLWAGSGMAGVFLGVTVSGLCDRD